MGCSRSKIKKNEYEILCKSHNAIVATSGFNAAHCIARDCHLDIANEYSLLAILSFLTASRRHRADCASLRFEYQGGIQCYKIGCTMLVSRYTVYGKLKSREWANENESFDNAWDFMFILRHDLLSIERTCAQRAMLEEINIRSKI